MPGTLFKIFIKYQARVNGGSNLTMNNKTKLGNAALLIKNSKNIKEQKVA